MFGAGRDVATTARTLECRRPLQLSAVCTMLRSARMPSMYSCTIRTLLNRGASAAMLARIRAIHRRGSLGIALEKAGHLLFEQRVELRGLLRVVVGLLDPVAERPTVVWREGSDHQPSSVERLSPPFTRTFMPLVPLASHGRRGVLIQTSTPWTSSVARRMSVVENRRAPAPPPG